MMRELPARATTALFLCHSERSEEPRFFLGEKHFNFDWDPRSRPAKRKELNSIHETFARLHPSHSINPRNAALRGVSRIKHRVQGSAPAASRAGVTKIPTLFPFPFRRGTTITGAPPCQTKITKI
jgi:hypothetical protein